MQVRSPFFFTATALVFGSLLLAGCQRNTPAPIPSPRPSAAVTVPLDATVNTASDAASVGTSTLESEKDYMLRMVAHHQETVDVARAFVAITDDENLRALAQGMINIQSAQLAQLKQWLSDWYQVTDSASLEYEPTMRHVQNLRGVALNRAFATDMAAHHELAIALSRQVQTLQPHREIQSMAGNIQVIQMEELLTLRDWLAKHPE